MPRTGKNIYKRKDGRWEGRYVKGRDPVGKLIYGSVYRKTYTEVMRRLLAFITDEPVPMSSTAAPGNGSLTFSDVANRWLSVISLKIKPSTCSEYTTALELHIIPSLGKLRMKDLTVVDISRFARKKLENGRLDGKGGHGFIQTAVFILQLC
jgi:hypothetical protein